jgi:ABC-type cobalamin transport system permease subunit
MKLRLLLLLATAFLFSLIAGQAMIGPADWFDGGTNALIFT